MRVFTRMSINQHIASFRFTRLLKADSQTKTIAILGEIGGDRAIVTIEKSPFQTGDIDLQKLITDISLINSNDVYFWSKVNLYQDLIESPGAKLNLIYPATETHIRKYDDQKLHYVRETPEMYQKYVAPYIETMKGDRLKWVYNILFEGKESETFIYHDKSPTEGFVLLPDMKWDGVNIQTLYLCCIVNRLDISSVRDLAGEHIEYLERLQDTIKKVATEKYPLEKDQLRVFIHYQPSYYHFHLHVVNVQHPGLGDGIAIGKAILLDDAISLARTMAFGK
ncbi:m7GpppX diphosphatase [Candida viswanathii]|uniref:M7GpppX diphosphatase n=1 Tax=Candida viswanathii TaxID=5486 RepID=A0A367YI18_9ASCO|nr:m7GpppX diphosphatase [Candida viswanathii]